jgi:hypothetical protein
MEETITVTMTKAEAKNLIFFDEPCLSRRLEDEIRRELRESKKNELRLKAVTDLEAFLNELVEEDYF